MSPSCGLDLAIVVLLSGGARDSQNARQRCREGAEKGVELVVGPAITGARAIASRQPRRQLCLSLCFSLLRGSVVEGLTTPLRVP
jgi:hypothetical protein